MRQKTAYGENNSRTPSLKMVLIVFPASGMMTQISGRDEVNQLFRAHPMVYAMEHTQDATVKFGTGGFEPKCQKQNAYSFAFVISVRPYITGTIPIYYLNQCTKKLHASNYSVKYSRTLPTPNKVAVMKEAMTTLRLTDNHVLKVQLPLSDSISYPESGRVLIESNQNDDNILEDIPIVVVIPDDVPAILMADDDSDCLSKTGQKPASNTETATNINSIIFYFFDFGVQ
ncbi:hypothetical protein EVAR_29006_1 [Eumeta japonica]|uniref:Uncharacterized protein n=1 Tax=Eumeta variegata TaxID=151549 RepID=A0A4C1W1S1_EUMVA|nr:hypothetical protein EVAR_29006_1 [Eumeta japonica]